MTKTILTDGGKHQIFFQLTMKLLITTYCISWLTIISGFGASQGTPVPAANSQARKSEVKVLAFDTFGRFLGPPEVRLFRSDDNQKSFAGQFHNGRALGIPEGIYHIEAWLPAYYSDSKLVRVYGKYVTVVLGLTVGSEAPIFPPSLSGRIIGKLPNADSFVRLIGVYSNVGIDSAIESNGAFTISGLSDGKYLLLVVGEKGILASRQLTIPYTGSPLRIELVQ